MTKHEMVINILRARYNAEIELARVGRAVKPRGQGVRKEYNKYMTQSIAEIKEQYITASRILSKSNRSIIEGRK